jgi:hypothetical protein
MSDSTRGLPAPAGTGAGAATPGSTTATPARTFRPTPGGRYINRGLEVNEGVARLRERRGAAPPQPAPGVPAPGAAAPAATAAVLPFSPLMALMNDPLMTPAPVPAAPAPQPAPGALPTPAAQPGYPAGDPVFNLNGQNVSLSELARGYMRMADYTAKTQEAAATIRQAQESKVAWDQQRVALEAKLPGLLGPLATTFEKIDWVKLAKDDPIGYARRDAEFKVLQAAAQEAANLANTRAQEEHSRKLEMRRLGHEFLCAVVPGWRDPTTRMQLQQAHLSHLSALGFTPDEISRTELLDPRHVVALEESRRYRVLVAVHPELLREAPRAEPPRILTNIAVGNGYFDRAPAGEVAAAEAQRTWDQLQVRTGATARDAAIALIGARRRGAQPLALGRR